MPMLYSAFSRRAKRARMATSGLLLGTLVGTLAPVAPVHAQGPATVPPSRPGEPSVMPGKPLGDMPGGLPDPTPIPVPETPEPEIPTPEPPVLPERNLWKYILIHHSASPNGNAASFDRMHRGKGWDGVAYHFVITNGKGGPDGGLQVSARWWGQKHGAHAGGAPWLLADERNAYNEFGIGICLVGNFEKSKPSKRQIDTLVKLVRKLQQQFDIPADCVMGHRHVKGTACPGRNFPWKTVMARMDHPAPTHLVKHTIYGTQERCPWCWKHDTVYVASRGGGSKPNTTATFTGSVPPPTGATLASPNMGSITPPPLGTAPSLQR